MWSGTSLWILLVFALAACERIPPRDQASWWCWTDSVCFAERTECESVAKVIDGELTCNSRAVAFCRRGCGPIQPGVTPSCGPSCGSDRETCEMLDGSTPCLEEAPPKYPAVFDYSTPGFWCHDIRGPFGNASWCVKDKEECEWILDDTLAKVGSKRATGYVGCSRPTAPVHCWSRRVEGKLVFTCVLTRDFCEMTRTSVLGSAAEVSSCAPWAYD